jgi:hypothetical protein
MMHTVPATARPHRLCPVVEPTGAGLSALRRGLHYSYTTVMTTPVHSLQPRTFTLGSTKQREAGLERRLGRSRCAGTTAMARCAWHGVQASPRRVRRYVASPRRIRAPCNRPSAAHSRPTARGRSCRSRENDLMRLTMLMRPGERPPPGHYDRRPSCRSATSGPACCAAAEAESSFVCTWKRRQRPPPPAARAVE